MGHEMQKSRNAFAEGVDEVEGSCPKIAVPSHMPADEGCAPVHMQGTGHYTIDDWDPWTLTESWWSSGCRIPHEGGTFLVKRRHQEHHILWHRGDVELSRYTEPEHRQHWCMGCYFNASTLLWWKFDDDKVLSGW